MESGKQGSSDTSSEENDRQEQVKDDTGTTTKRSYECTFCKRGFTNAQALGGHMNIHRKDRAKAKQQLTGSSISSKPMNEDFMNPRYMAPISSQSSRYYPASEAQRNYHQMYFQPSVSIPRHPYAYHSSDLFVPRSQSLSMNDDYLGANLSLRIGSNHVEGNEVRRVVVKEDEVDLELRLGHDP